MIEIKEKEPFELYNQWNLRECLMYPNVMVKDGKEYFIRNRRESMGNYEKDEFYRGIEQLKANDGTYLRFYGLYDKPTNMLEEIINRKHSFSNSDINELFRKETMKPYEEFVDFRGNRKEVADAFMYRLYDNKIVND